MILSFSWSQICLFELQLSWLLLSCQPQLPTHIDFEVGIQCRAAQTNQSDAFKKHLTVYSVCVRSVWTGYDDINISAFTAILIKTALGLNSILTCYSVACILLHYTTMESTAA